MDSVPARRKEAQRVHRDSVRLVQTPSHLILVRWYNCRVCFFLSRANSRSRAPTAFLVGASPYSVTSLVYKRRLAAAFPSRNSTTCSRTSNKHKSYPHPILERTLCVLASCTFSRTASSSHKVNATPYNIFLDRIKPASTKNPRIV